VASLSSITLTGGTPLYVAVQTASGGPILPAAQLSVVPQNIASAAYDPNGQNWELVGLVSGTGVVVVECNGYTTVQIPLAVNMASLALFASQRFIPSTQGA